MALKKSPSTKHDIPVLQETAAGEKILLDTKAYLVLEGGKVAEKGGAFTSPRRVVLHRTVARNEPVFTLVVSPDSTGAGGRQLVVDRRVTITPGLRAIRQTTNFVKPDGESLAKAVMTSTDTKEVKLFTFSVRRPGSMPVLSNLGVGAQTVTLGFERLEEALGAYIYLASCSDSLADGDVNFEKVIGREKSLADKIAGQHCVMLCVDDCA